MLATWGHGTKEKDQEDDQPKEEKEELKKRKKKGEVKNIYCQKY